MTIDIRFDTNNLSYEELLKMQNSLQRALDEVNHIIKTHSICAHKHLSPVEKNGS